MKLGLVISLCDRSGVMVRPWAEAGYDCYCVDTAHPTAEDRVEKVGAGQITFAWGDARSWKPPVGRRVFVAAFPMCTHLANSGAKHFERKGLPMLMDGLDLFNHCVQAGAWSGAPYCVENPAGVVSSHFRKPDYVFDPHDYAGYGGEADAYQKRTCLWTGGGFVMPLGLPVEPVLGSKMHNMPDSTGRAERRSLTPAGFANAVYLANAPHLRLL